MFKAEDEQDACAAARAKAEQAAELAEFDEGIPLSEDGSGKVSRKLFKVTIRKGTAGIVAIYIKARHPS